MTSPEQVEYDWRKKAACRFEDPELFFPIGNTGPALMQINEAKAVCNRCSVVDLCLKWALENDEKSGVWGGMGEDERKNLSRRLARQAKASNKTTANRDEHGLTFDEYVVPYEKQLPNDDF